MSHEHAIDLTPAEMKRVETFAEQNGMTVEEASVLLARQSIEKYFVLPKSGAEISPFRALKRERQ